MAASIKSKKALELAEKLGWTIKNPQEVLIQLVYGQLKRRGYVWSSASQTWIDRLDPNDLRTYKVQVKPCKSCPFAGEKPVLLEPERYQELIENLLGNGQHFCHSVNDRMICRGGRTFQLRWLRRIGVIPEPTDKAFNHAVNKALKDK